MTSTRLGIAPPAYRLPDAAHVGTVDLQVSDLERSLAWYQQVLGLQRLVREGSRAELGASGSSIPLLRLHEQPGAKRVPSPGRIGLYHFAILLPDRASLGRFVAHLAEIGARAGAADHLVSEALYLHDPDGLGIEVYADRPRDSWQADGGELRMATLPLDVASLVESAKGERWSGMPAGTTMGHIHLHVGDLQRASAFYHAALGLDTMVWSYTGALFMSAGGYHHHLGLNTWAGADAIAAREDEARLLAWQLVLPDAASVADARRSIASSGVGTRDARDGWLAADPWGTTLHVVAAPRVG
ncbi:MAG TPA: VOC family protein [Gemmatimonadaceae bacterium]|nr:VOC family protein [Gemmatimonadaceae bacterium]